MKPTQQEIIELAREAGIDRESHYTAVEYREPWNSCTDEELVSLVRLALERFGAGGGEPTGYLVGHSGEYHYFRHKADAEREKAEQERCSGESCGDVEPVFRHPSPTDLRAEYLRGLDDAKKVALDAGDGEQVTCDGDFPEGFNASLGIPAQALRTANAIMFDVIGKREWDVPCTAQHLLSFVKRYTHPSPTDLRAERLRVLEDAAKACEDVARLYSEAALKHPEDSESRSRTFARSRAARQCADEIRALKGKQ